MRIKLFLIILLFPIISFAQKVDTIIKMSAYTSYYSFLIKNPLMVSYTLYHGGGDCSRTKNNFYFRLSNINTACKKDYSYSTFDMGHLANAEDFAYDCKLEEETFRFWNCMPQTQELNRGIWRVLETKIREISQTDSIIVFCGGFYSNKGKVIGNRVHVPDYCWKMVYSFTENKVLGVYLMSNTTKPVTKQLTLSDLKKMLAVYLITLPEYIK